MEALKRTEQPVNMVAIEAGAVVLDEKDRFFAFVATAEFDARRFPPRGVLPGISKQVLQNYADQSLIAEGHTAVCNRDLHLPFAALCQAPENGFRQGSHVYRNVFERSAPRPGKIQ